MITVKDVCWHREMRTNDNRTRWLFIYDFPWGREEFVVELYKDWFKLYRMGDGGLYMVWKSEKSTDSQLRRAKRYVAEYINWMLEML